jgi:hypothetical protein
MGNKYRHTLQRLIKKVKSDTGCLKRKEMLEW